MTTPAGSGNGNSSTEGTGGAPPPSTPPGAGNAAEGRLETTGFKWGKDAPPVLQGRSPQETIDLVNKLVTSVTDITTARAQMTQQQHFTPQPQAQPLNPDLMIENPAEWQRQFAQALSANQASQLANVAQPVLAQQAETAEWMSKQDPKRAKVWERYGHEIAPLIAQVPLQYRTKSFYDKAADLIRAEHVDELMEERFAEKLTEYRASDTASSAGAGYRDERYGAGTSGDAEVWAQFEGNAYGKHMLETVGRSGIAEHCRREGIKLADYAKTVGRSRTKTPSQGEPGVFWTDLVQD